MEKIIKAYVKYVKKNKQYPSYSDLFSLGVTKSEIRNKFVNLENLHKHIQENHSDEIDQYVIHEDTVFSKKKLQELNQDLKKYKKFFVTAVVSGKPVDTKFLASIKNYCKRNDAKLLLLPCADTSSFKKLVWFFAPELKDETFVSVDSKINENLFISAIKLTAKQINPTTGLSRIGQRNGSYIFASPKQFLEYVPTNHEPGKIAHAIMTPGALTKADYQPIRYMSDRTAYIAENDHVIGGLIIEVKNSKTFHFRQVQADTEGSFIDLGLQYNADGTTEEKVGSLVIEWHNGETDPVMKKIVDNITSTMNIRDIFVHDGFDGYSVTHHIKDKPLDQAKRSNESRDSLENEVMEFAFEIKRLSNLIPGKVYMVKSNHDERLQKYLIRGDYVNDPKNHYYSLDLAKAYLEGKDPLKVAVENVNGINDPYKIVWLTRDDSVKIAGVEMAKHGDLGSNGGAPSLLSLEKSLSNCFVGHNHSAAILRGVWRMGTCTHLKLAYNTGASSWTQTVGIIYDNGARQLLNNIKGEWKLD